MPKFDLIVIGGGFYGSMLAIHESEKGKKVALVETEDDILRRASSINQAIIHRGYHYPRSAMTARSSIKNCAKFERDFKSAVYKEHTKYHGVANRASFVTPEEYYNFCLQNINSDISLIPNEELPFNLVNATAFKTPEFSLNYKKLRQILWKRLKKVEVYLNTKAIRIEGDTVITSGGALKSKHVAICAYANINDILHRSDLPLIDLKYQLTEMALVDVPKAFKKVGFTLMDGPFFSLTPFPAENCHVLSHVKYTVHAEWRDDNMFFSWHPAKKPRSNFKFMQEAVKQYLPDLQLKFKKSLFDVKSLLPVSCHDDGRPILMHEINPNCTVINGSKLDNVYDMLDEWDQKSGETNVIRSK